MIASKNFKPLKNNCDCYIYGIKATYCNGLSVKYIPYKVIDGLDRMIDANSEENFKPLKKVNIKEWIEVKDWILTTIGDLVQVEKVNDTTLKVFNGVNTYELELKEVYEVVKW